MVPRPVPVNVFNIVPKGGTRLSADSISDDFVGCFAADEGAFTVSINGVWMVCLPVGLAKCLNAPIHQKKKSLFCLDTVGTWKRHKFWV